jgi:hypothetical protein
MMPVSPRMSIVATFCLLGLLLSAASVNASGSEPESKSPSDNESAILKRVLDNWRARESRIKSFYLCWNSQWTMNKSTAPYGKTRTEFWMYGDLRYRTIKSNVRRRRATGSNPANTEQETFEESSEVAFDGATTRELLGRQAEGRILNGEDLSPWQRGERFPVLLTYRPLIWRPRLRVVSQNAIIGKSHCVKLERREDSSVETFWVDTARGDLVVAWEKTSSRPYDRFLTIDYDHDSKYGWVPARWTCTYQAPPTYHPEGMTSSSTVTRFTINERIPADMLTLKFPPGTTVLDFHGLERHVVAKDGSKRDITKCDSADTLKIYEALEQEVEFAIEEEPLRDALDFIAQRYQIKVAIDANAVRQRQIDPSIEVKMRYSGIKLKSLLNILLEQSRKPLTYAIRQGVLTVLPAGK